MKKTIAFILAIVMVFSLMPMTAFAAEEDGTISFETTFTDDMAVGDTFQVTGLLSNNPGIYTMTVSLKWNEDVVRFTGFDTEYDEDEEADVLLSDVFSAMPALVYNNELGIIVGCRTGATNTKKNGSLFVANFEIIGSGDLDIALKDTDRTEFEMVNFDMEVLTPMFDYSALEGLSVAAPATGGAVIPDGAPFTAVSTDAGEVLVIEQMDDVNGVPYYIVTIPEDAETAYITAPDQVIMEDWNSGEMQATAYAYEIENGWNQQRLEFRRTAPLYVPCAGSQRPVSGHQVHGTIRLALCGHVPLLRHLRRFHQP